MILSRFEHSVGLGRSSQGGMRETGKRLPQREPADASAAEDLAWFLESEAQRPERTATLLAQARSRLRARRILAPHTHRLTPSSLAILLALVPSLQAPKCITMTAKCLPSVPSRTDLFPYRYPSGNADRQVVSPILAFVLEPAEPGSVELRLPRTARAVRRRFEITTQ